MEKAKNYNYYDQGQIESTIQYIYVGQGDNRKKEKIVTKWSASGKMIAQYKDGKIWNGKSITWWDEKNNKKKEEITISDGKVEGLNTVWYKNGKKKQEGLYKNGLMDGKWIYWWDNGVLKAEGFFQYGDGKNLHKNFGIPMNGRTGKWIGWHKNGQKWCEINFKNGKKHGSHVNWYENGKQELNGQYKDGKSVGNWTWWYEDGYPFQEGKYLPSGEFEGLYFITPNIPAVEHL